MWKLGHFHHQLVSSAGFSQRKKHPEQQLCSRGHCTVLKVSRKKREMLKLLQQSLVPAAFLPFFLTNLHLSCVVKDVKMLREGSWAESLPQCYKTFRVTTRIERFEQMVIALWSQIFKWPNLILHRPANNRFDATDHSKVFERVTTPFLMFDSLFSNSFFNLA